MKKTIEKASQALMTRVSATGENRPDDRTSDEGRRHFLKLNLFGLALAPIAILFAGEAAWAGRTGRIVDNTPAVLDPEDPQAEALNYSAKSHKEGQSCSNCQLYTGSKGEAVGPCAIFSYRVASNGGQVMVNAAGWCRAWAPRQPL